MSILGIGAIGLIALGNVAVAFTNLKAAIVALRLPRLSDIEPRMPPGPGGGRRDWPSLSVVVAACNEAETIGAAARQLLQVDYPDLEIIIVNDRSTDGTGAIIDRLAAGDARIVPVHVA